MAEEVEQGIDSFVPDFFSIAAARLETGESVVSTLQVVESGVRGQRGSIGQFVWRGKGITGTGAEDRGHANGGEVSIPPLLWTPGRVKRVGEESEGRSFATLGYDLGRDPAPHGTAACDHRQAGLVCLVQHGAPGRFQRWRPVGSTATGLHVRKLETPRFDVFSRQPRGAMDAEAIVNVGAGARSIEEQQANARWRGRTLNGDRPVARDFDLEARRHRP